MAERHSLNQMSQSPPMLDQLRCPEKSDDGHFFRKRRSRVDGTCPSARCSGGVALAPDPPGCRSAVASSTASRTSRPSSSPPVTRGRVREHQPGCAARRSRHRSVRAGDLRPCPRLRACPQDPREGGPRCAAGLHLSPGQRPAFSPAAARGPLRGQGRPRTLHRAWNGGRARQCQGNRHRTTDRRARRS
jgi:hypothetical protein